MLEQTLKAEQVWNTVQEPRCPVYMPTGYMLLLSALDKGWQIESVELTPSWDQYGFVYLVTLRRPSHKYSQQIILPKNPVVEYLLFDGAGSLFNKPVHHYLGVHA
ncbi:MAG TPA: hypothetical protein VII97_00190 [Anaerolineales bacterium]